MSEDLVKRLRAMLGTDVASEAADRIEALERERDEYARAAAGDPDSCIALTGELHARATTAESALAAALKRLAEVAEIAGRSSDARLDSANEKLGRIATIASNNPNG